MKIEQDQVASIEPFGILDGKTVNIVRLKGGLNIATHCDSKGEESVIGAASHQAILSYTLEQRYSNFQPMIMKSEKGIKLNADSHSHFLTDDLRKSGHDIFSIQSGQHVDFYVTKMNVEIGKVSGYLEKDGLIVSKMSVPGEFAAGMSSALSEKALSSGLNKVKWS